MRLVNELLSANSQIPTVSAAPPAICKTQALMCRFPFCFVDLKAAAPKKARGLTPLALARQTADFCEKFHFAIASLAPRQPFRSAFAPHNSIAISEALSSQLYAPGITTSSSDVTFLSAFYVEIGQFSRASVSRSTDWIYENAPRNSLSDSLFRELHIT